MVQRDFVLSYSASVESIYTTNPLKNQRAVALRLLPVGVARPVAKCAKLRFRQSRKRSGP